MEKLDNKRREYVYYESPLDRCQISDLIVLNRKLKFISKIEHNYCHELQCLW